ncbi:uncharacterized protein [Diadema antillarum]|uniref:uncharacterized protein n=1 Tax=Diadema antillarum TaxID=105358 RepID=UPI003A8949B8
MITLDCDEGYVLTGNATLICETSSNGGPVWNTSIPSCLEDESNETKCIYPVNVPNGKWDSNTTLLGSVISLACDEGYALNGSATLLCVTLSYNGSSTHSPVWNSSTPSCLPDKSPESKCDRPGNVLHGRWDSNITRPGSLITLDCDDGYTLTGSAALLCVTSFDNGSSTHKLSWNASTPSCQAAEAAIHPFKPWLIYPIVSFAVFFTMLSLICAVWCVYRRQRYKTSLNSNQIDSGMAGVQSSVQSRFPGNGTNSGTFSLYTLVPPVDNSITAGGYPVPVGAEDSTFDHDHIYQDAEEIRRDVAEMHGISERAISVEGGDNHHSFDSQRLVTSEQSLLETSHLKPSREAKEYEYDNLAHTAGIGSVTTGRDTTLQRLRLFDETEYNSLESTVGPDVGRNVMRPHVSKATEPTSCTGNTNITNEERSLNSTMTRQPAEVLEWKASYGENEYNSIDTASPANDKPKMLTSTQSTSNNSLQGDSLTANFPVSIAHNPLTPGEVVYEQVDSSEFRETVGSQTPNLSSAFNSDDCSLLIRRRDDMTIYKDDEYVDDSSATSVVTPRSCEELYTNAEIQRNGFSTEITSFDELQGTTEYDDVTNTATMGLYAEVDKRGDMFSKEDSSVSTKEELYAKVNKQRDLPSNGDGFIEQHQGTTIDEKDAEAAPVPLYAQVNKGVESFDRENRSSSVRRREEMYGKVDKQRDGRSMGNGSTDVTQGTTEDEKDTLMHPLKSTKR